MRAIIGLSPEEQDKAVGAAADAEQQYKQAGNAAADQAEAGVDRATQQVGTVAACLLLRHCLSGRLPAFAVIARI